MKEGNLKLAQEDIEAALKAVEDIENFINDESLEKDVLKQKFVALSEKVQQLENLLKRLSDENTKLREMIDQINNKIKE